MAGQFHKEINNARNSNDAFEVQIDEDPVKAKGPRRASAAQLQRSIAHGLGTRKNFTTITPHGLPADLVGTVDNAVERQNALVEPRGVKNEGARLPPFKPFKTISDEDNIHLLPGETGERARLNLLDTKAVTRKNVEEVRTAYFKLKEQYPDLYRKQKAPVEEAPPPPPPVVAKKQGFFGKLFGKKEKSIAPVPPVPPTPAEVKPPERHQSIKPPPERKPPVDASVVAKADVKKPEPPRKSVRPRVETSSSESESDDDDEEELEYNRRMTAYYNAQQGGGYPPMYPQQQQQYPGFPGGYGPSNQVYPGGFGPTQAPPFYNPCIEEIQYGGRNKSEGDKDGRKKRERRKRQQGLNFDFLPHDDLATEVTMTIEPDEPEPLQYAVENGIMPIICCYMPSSLAVNQQPQQHQSTPNAIPFSGYPSSSYGYSNNYSSYPYPSQQATSPVQGSGGGEHFSATSGGKVSGGTFQQSLLSSQSLSLPFGSE